MVCRNGPLCRQLLRIAVEEQAAGGLPGSLMRVCCSEQGRRRLPARLMGDCNGCGFPAGSDACCQDFGLPTGCHAGEGQRSRPCGRSRGAPASPWPHV